MIRKEMRAMRCQTIIDKQHEEEVVIYVHERSSLSEEIERLVQGRENKIVGYADGEIMNLNISEVCCFAVIDNKIYAVCDRKRFHIKQRLYSLEEMLGDDFVKINQSCIANIKKIERFDTSFAGSLSIVFKNGYRDYVSRRQLKTVKERIGF